MNPASAPGHLDCLKCGHTRLPSDVGPDHSCPRCGAVYAKVIEALRVKAAAAARAGGVPAAGDEGMATAQGVARRPQEAAGLRLSRTADRQDMLLAHLVYLLYALPFGTALVGVIVAHVMRRTQASGWLQTHYRWQVRTFWIGLGLLLVLLVVVALTARVSFAYFRATGKLGGPIFWGGMGGASRLAFVALILWALYRLVKGWVQLFRGREVH